MMRKIRFCSFIALAIIAFAACGRNEGQDGEIRLFHEQTSSPISIAAGSQRQYILMDDGSLWMWGWHSDGTGGRDFFRYAHMPIHVKDGVAEILVDGLSFTAILEDGEVVDMGWLPRWQSGGGRLAVGDAQTAVSQNGTSTLIINENGDVYAHGEFMIGHLQPSTILRGNNEAFVQVLIDGVFTTFHQILTEGVWMIMESSNEEMLTTDPLTNFDYNFNSDGTKELRFHGMGNATQIGESASWQFLQDGRLKIDDEIFTFNLIRNVSSQGTFDQLHLTSGYNYLTFIRMTCDC